VDGAHYNRLNRQGQARSGQRRFTTINSTPGGGISAVI
jgi:hypothetical protein